MRNQDHLSLQIWESKNGSPTMYKLDAGGFDVVLGHESKLSLRNPNEKLWCDISQIRTALSDTSLEKPVFIPPLTTVEITYKIAAKDSPDENYPSVAHNDRIEGKITWCELVYPEGSQ